MITTRRGFIGAVGWLLVGGELAAEKPKLVAHNAVMVAPKLANNRSLAELVESYMNYSRKVETAMAHRERFGLVEMTRRIA